MANNVFYTSLFLLTLIIGHLLRGRRNQKSPGIVRGVLTSTPWNDPLSVDPSSELGASSEEALPRLCQLWKRFKTRVVSQFLSHWGWHKLASKRCSALWDCWEALPAADKTNCSSTADFLIPISVCGSVHCQNYTGTGLSNMKDILSCLKCLIWKSLVRADRWYCIVLSLCCARVPSWAVGLRALTTGCWRIWMCCGMGTDAPVVSCGGWKWGNLGGCEHQLCSSGLKEAEWAQIAGRMVCFGFCFSTGSLNLQDIVTSLQWEMSSREVPLQKTFLPTQLLPENSQPQVGKGLHYTLLLCPNESRFSLAKGSVCAC